MAISGRACELCGGEAAVHCEPDSAFLCWACDAQVHGSNFLAARHGRRCICSECGAFDAGNTPLLFGPVVSDAFSLCCSCSVSSSYSDSESQSSSSRSSSSRISGAKAAERRRRRRRPSSGELDVRVDIIIANWCGRLGLGADGTAAACHALAAGMRRAPALPLRVGMAAAVWFAAKLQFSRGVLRDARLLRVLEEFSGVSAKLISVGEANLSRSMRWRHEAEHSEGWAECS